MLPVLGLGESAAVDATAVAVGTDVGKGVVDEDFTGVVVTRVDSWPFTVVKSGTSALPFPFTV